MFSLLNVKLYNYCALIFPWHKENSKGDVRDECTNINIKVFFNWCNDLTCTVLFITKRHSRILITPGTTCSFLAARTARQAGLSFLCHFMWSLITDHWLGNAPNQLSDRLTCTLRLITRRRARDLPDYASFHGARETRQATLSFRCDQEALRIDYIIVSLAWKIAV